MATRLFNTYKEASEVAKDISVTNKVTIKFGRKGSGFFVDIPDELDRAIDTPRPKKRPAVKAKKARKPPRPDKSSATVALPKKRSPYRRGEKIDVPHTKVAKPEQSGSSLVDLLAVASGLSIEILSKAKPDPLAIQAIELVTSRSINELQKSPEAFAGAISAAKGKYFELLAEQELNSGNSVGNFSLDAGQRAEIAETLNQPGWDLRVEDNNGELVDEIQLKATDSVAYIRDALDRYPDIQVLSTTEVAGKSEFGGLVIDSGVSNEEVTRVVEAAATGEMASSTFFESFNPLVPLTVIAATEGYRVVVGSQTIEEFGDALASRAPNSLTGTVVGAAFMAMGFGWLSIVPAMMATKAGPDGIAEALRSETDAERLERKRKDAQRLNATVDELGLTEKYDETNVPETSLTGVKLIDDPIRDFVLGIKFGWGSQEYHDDHNRKQYESFCASFVEMGFSLEEADKMWKGG